MKMSSFKITLLTILATLLLPTINGQAEKTRQSKQVILIPYDSPYEPESGPQHQYYPQYEPNNPYYNHPLTRAGYGTPNPKFFGLISNGLQNFFNSLKPNCPSCPSCPNQSCSSCLIGSATLTVADASIAGCSALATINTACVKSSLASSGTISVTYVAGTTGGQALVSLLAQQPNTKVRVICPTIPAGITVKTQSATLTANNAQEEASGFATVFISGSNTVAANTVLTCTWTSLP